MEYVFFTFCCTIAKKKRNIIKKYGFIFCMEMKETKAAVFIFNFYVDQECEYWGFSWFVGEFSIYLHVKLLRVGSKKL